MTSNRKTWRKLINNGAEQFQKELSCKFKHCIDVLRTDLPETDYDFWCVVFKDKFNHDIFRRDADANEINAIMKNLPDDKFIHIWREFDVSELPYKWTIWPHSRSKLWETKIIESTMKYA